MATINAESGRQFDPDVVAAFKQVAVRVEVTEMHAARKRFVAELAS